MSLLCWNVRGLGNQRTENQLTEIMWAKDPSVVFLAEAWTDEDRLIRIQDRLQFKHRFAVHRTRKAGGLVLFWKENFKLDVQTFSKYHIDAKINQNTDEEWRFTDFYGEPDTNKRHEAWNKLRRLRNRGSSTWICAGDFNEITRQSEKIGGRGRPHNQMQPFRELFLRAWLPTAQYLLGDWTSGFHFGQGRVALRTTSPACCDQPSSSA
ncbi:hypothetical protein SO802_001123 [Lithocarpus litseifolius]|uniref:Endonuclease/exonuclease/phosphatase domain-containing protein n=1 Tax=Lithocarpus litseifolius TaxID=425828 RepID=A0AAW2DVA0_9ROSI